MSRHLGYRFVKIEGKVYAANAYTGYGEDRFKDQMLSIPVAAMKRELSLQFGSYQCDQGMNRKLCEAIETVLEWFDSESYLETIVPKGEPKDLYKHPKATCRYLELIKDPCGSIKEKLESLTDKQKAAMPDYESIYDASRDMFREYNEWGLGKKPKQPESEWFF